MFHKISIRFVGARPLLMHSDRGVNPLDPAVKAHKKLTGVRNKTDEIQEKIARSEFELSMYFDADVHDKDGKLMKAGIGPYIPCAMIEASLRDAAKLSKRGKDVGRAVMVVEPIVALEYDGPRTIQGLWDAKFYDMRSVVVQRARTMRCRPIFPEWELNFSLWVNANIFNVDTIEQIARAAGEFGGLGDYRPQYGRFAANILDVAENIKEVA